MILMIDNYDSFTYNLVRYFQQLDEEITVVCNDQITVKQIIKLKPKAIVLSPGPKRPEDAKICIDIVRELSGKIPILGICLGHQVIGMVNNLDVKCGQFPIHGKVSTIFHKSNDNIFNSIPNEYQATRYHSLVVLGENEKIEVLAKSSDGVNMIIREKNKPTYGIQYHPESFLTQHGYQILSNFLKISEEFNA